MSLSAVEIRNASKVCVCVFVCCAVSAVVELRVLVVCSHMPKVAWSPREAFSPYVSVFSIPPGKEHVRQAEQDILLLHEWR